MIQSRFVSLFCLMTLVLSCKRHKEVETPFEKQKFPKIIDRMVEQRTELDSVAWLAYAFNQPFYFGALLDTIELDRKISDKSDYFVVGYDYINVLTIDSASVGIKIDTSQVINSLGLKSNPVLIYNKTKDTISIGAEGRIYFVIEGKTKAGEWKPIEKHFFPFCGTDVSSIILPPSKLALSSAINYSGNYKTKLRIKMGLNYSKEFDGWINESQFKNEPMNEKE